ncbi:MAG: hypothetical protein Q9O74_03915 [Planctomycetota bacterium]|nr:hypothetical protein [Planctomycetota bacterium]
MIRTTALLVLAGAATANAGIFSFASDFSDQSWTFSGEFHGGHFALEDGIGNADPMTLLIDDANGVLEPLSYQVDFNMHADVDYLSSTPIGGGKFLHTYVVEETFAGWFTDTGPVLEMTFDGSIITVVGDEFSWDSAGSMFGADSWADVQYTSYIDAPAYGMYVGDSVGPQDFGFSLTAINTSGALPYDFGSPGAALDPQTMFPIDEIFAEGSYSGSARFVPTPATATLLLGAGLMGIRRRR